MSKGCFIKFIIILTIVIAAVLYIVQTKFDEWIVTPGKKLVKVAFNESWEEDLAFVKPSPEKDSVKILIENYIDNIDPDSISEKEIDLISNTVEAVASDSLIDEQDLNVLRNIFKAQNERSKKN